MNRLLLKVAFAVFLTAASLWPLAALAYDGIHSASGPPARSDVLLAYIDPGAGGFIIVTVLGFISAIGYMARSYLVRLKGMMFRSGAVTRERKDGEER